MPHQLPLTEQRTINQHLLEGHDRKFMVFPLCNIVHCDVVRGHTQKPKLTDMSLRQSHPNSPISPEVGVPNFKIVHKHHKTIEHIPQFTPKKCCSHSPFSPYHWGFRLPQDTPRRRSKASLLPLGMQRATPGGLDGTSVREVIYNQSFLMVYNTHLYSFMLDHNVDKTMS
jgi:hypothetical protein